MAGHLLSGPRFYLRARQPQSVWHMPATENIVGKLNSVSSLLLLRRYVSGRQTARRLGPPARRAQCPRRSPFLKPLPFIVVLRIRQRNNQPHPTRSNPPSSVAAGAGHLGDDSAPLSDSVVKPAPNPANHCAQHNGKSTVALHAPRGRRK
jgi:hypothetical protein